MRKLKIVEKFEEIISQYKKTLSLSNECTYLSLYSDTSIIWDDDKNCWRILHNPRNPPYLLIHELGHIFIYKKTNYIYFVKQRSKKGIIEGIYNCIEGPTDSFVNINLCNYEQIYTLYLDYIKKLIDLEYDLSTINMYELLGEYFHFYLDFNYVLNKEDKQSLNGKMIRILQIIKNALIVKSKKFKEIKYIIKNFQKINLYLDNFDDIKFTDEPKVIIGFNFELLKILQLWSIRMLREQFKLIYPDIDLSFLK